MRRRGCDITDVTKLAAAFRELANRFDKGGKSSDRGDDAAMVWDLGQLYRDVHAFLEFHKSPEYAESFLRRWQRLLELREAAREHSATRYRQMAARAEFLLANYYMRKHLRWLASMFEGGRIPMKASGVTRKKRVGRPEGATKYNPKIDKKWADAWQSRRYPTYLDCANALNVRLKDFKKGLERHRKRTKALRKK